MDSNHYYLHFFVANINIADKKKPSTSTAFLIKALI